MHNARQLFLNVRWLAIILLPIGALACTWMGGGGNARPLKDPGEIIIYVNGEPILQGDLDRVILEIISYAPPQFDEMQIRAKMPQIERRARDQLVEQKVLEQTINKEGIRIGAEQIEAEIQAMEAYYQAHGASLEATMLESEQTTTELRSLVRKQLALNALIDKRLNIPQPCDEDRRVYYENHQAQFTWPEAVRLQQILIAYPREEIVDKKQRLQLREKAMFTRARLLAGEDFAKVAMEISDAPDAKQGGNLGWINRQASLPVNLIEAAFIMPDGEISDVIRTALGNHIIRVIERRPERVAPMEEVTAIIDQDLMKVRREGKWDSLIKMLVDDADIVEL